MHALTLGSTVRSAAALAKSTWKRQLALFGIVVIAMVIITAASALVVRGLHLSESMAAFSRYRLPLYLIGYAAYLAFAAFVQQLYCTALLFPARSIAQVCSGMVRRFPRFLAWTALFAVISQLAFAPYFIGVYASFRGAIGPAVSLPLLALGVILLLLCCAYCSVVPTLLAEGASFSDGLRESIRRTHRHVGAIISILLSAALVIGLCTMVLNAAADRLGAWGLLLELLTQYIAVSLMFSLIVTIHNRLR